MPTLPEKEEGEPIRTDGKLVLEHPLTVADLGDGARTAQASGNFWPVRSWCITLRQAACT